MANILTDPPFAANPPMKVNINAKVLGLVIAILAAIGAVLGLIALPTLLALNNAVSSACNSLNAIGLSCGTSGGIFFLGLLGLIIALVGEVLAAIGGFRMYQLNRQGKDWVIYGLILGVIGGILEVIGYSTAFIGAVIFNILIALVFYYLVVISRFPGDAPLVASPTGGYGSPPPPPPA